eukprot:CAMPEP_0174340684 /NCGR_PEP_ID=MMETSP0810-20121108/24833_1 /TAXON_ID=73025 ORGANISM="Eutreptiella gymnastica-like, Strain CCMP1594" /NCGR_SAMPLE_ID=MMETSP0810 /ASSEMBLY_ACC=CAM_ASM_000659 /LENGTH=36 /DNA_ID= /DNA_START= /DNA_END= /DNA_ORIENTATION=
MSLYSGLVSVAFGLISKQLQAPIPMAHKALSCNQSH